MTGASSISDNLLHAAGQLQGCSESPRLDAELLLCKVLVRSRAALIAHGDAQLADESRREYERLIRERQRGVPLAYLTGTREFWSLPLNVTPAVLVPRPETEDLVELILQRLPQDRDVSVLDLGTGSGAIALAIASERPRATVTATDLSEAALEVAAGNARRLGLRNIDWRCGSWFEAVAERRFDVIASNPPYVAAGDPALAELRQEPALALTPGPGGFEAFAAIAAGAAAHLAPRGLLALEHGSTQAAALAALLAAHGFDAISSHSDRAGLPRVMLATVQPSTQEPS
ncbi:MAG: peptide chain release factor N(5)-glutamine methyltransferase [Steroidobacterales bacterium]